MKFDIGNIDTTQIEYMAAGILKSIGIDDDWSLVNMQIMDGICEELESENVEGPGVCINTGIVSSIFCQICGRIYEMVENGPPDHAELGEQPKEMARKLTEENNYADQSRLLLEGILK